MEYGQEQQRDAIWTHLVCIVDDREQRMIGIGLLDFLVVLIVHVESPDEIRIISMRKADSDETDLFYQNAGYF